jgi:hypothetical protein
MDPMPRKDAELPPRMPEAATIARLTAELEAARAERDALIGAAYKAAASVKVLRFEEGSHRAKVPLQPETQAAIRALTPPDATVALDRIKAEAALAGWKRGRDDAAEVADEARARRNEQRKQYPDDKAQVMRWMVGALQSAYLRDAIRALTPPADLGGDA